MSINSLHNLTWGHYETSLVTAVQLLRCHGDLVDCTLAAGGRIFPAHKLVLCAASPFLLDLFKNTPCKHPIVMLAGVSANDLEALLEFLYRGEVSVDHTQLPSLLQAALFLKIQGIAPETSVPGTTSIQPLPTLIPQQHIKVETDVGNYTISATETPPPSTFDNQTVEASEEIKQEQPEYMHANENQNDDDNTMVYTQDDFEEFQQTEQPISDVSDQEINPEVPINIKANNTANQPAPYSICNSVMKQSGHLRHHLETTHFTRRSGKIMIPDGNNIEFTSEPSQYRPSTSQMASVLPIANSQFDGISFEEQNHLESLSQFADYYNDTTSMLSEDYRSNRNMVYKYDKIKRKTTNRNGPTDDEINFLLPADSIAALNDLEARAADDMFSSKMLALLKSKKIKLGFDGIFRLIAKDNVYSKFNLDGRCKRRALLKLKLFSEILYQASSELTRKEYETQLRKSVLKAHNRINKANSLARIKLSKLYASFGRK